MKKLKQWRCWRCKKVFETERKYKTRTNRKICDDCLKKIPSQKGKLKKSPIRELERKINEFKNK